MSLFPYSVNFKTILIYTLFYFLLKSDSGFQKCGDRLYLCDTMKGWALYFACSFAHLNQEKSQTSRLLSLVEPLCL